MKKQKIFSLALIIILIFGFSVYFSDTANAELFLFKIPSGPTLTLVKDVAVDSSGNIYAVLNEKVLKFNSAGTILLEFGTDGTGDNQFKQPHGIAVDSSNNIYVADTFNDRVKKFNLAGVFQGWMGRCTSGASCDIPNEKSNGFSCSDATCSVFGSDDGSNDGQFHQPKGITVDSSNNLYVVDENNNRVQKFNLAGTFQGWMGSCTAGSNCDVGNQKSNGFDCTTATCTIGSFGSGDGQFNAPQSIVFDGSDNIYVLDGGNRRVQKFNSAEVFQGWMGKCTSGTGCDIANEKSNGFSCTAATCSGIGSGNGDGQFQFPQDMGIDNSNNIFVAGTINAVIQKFDSDGTFQGWMSMCGSGSNCDIPNQRSNGFSCTRATCTGPFSGVSSAEGQFLSPRGMAIDSAGDIYVAESSHTSRIQKFNSAGVVLTVYGSGGSEDGKFRFPEGIALDDSGDIYVADGGNNRVQIFNSAGVFQSNFGTIGNGDGELQSPVYIAFDNSNNIYVSEANNNRIQKFNSVGAFQGWMGKCTSGTNCDDTNQKSIGFSCTEATCSGPNQGTSDGQFCNPFGIAFDTSGNFYVAESCSHRIQKFNSAGTFQGWMGKCTGGTGCDIPNERSTGFSCSNSCTGSGFVADGSGDGQFDSPHAITIDSSNNLYVVDKDNNRIQKFNPAGTFQGWMGKCTGGAGCDSGNQISNGFSCSDAACSGLGSGNNDGQFSIPRGITVDSFNNIYVTDTTNPRVQSFNSAGDFQLSFGSSGTGDGQFNSPGGIAVDGFGDMYVVDSSNHRVQIFAQTCIIETAAIDTTISSSCTVTSDVIAGGSVTVQSGLVMIIPSGITLDIDFTTENLTVESGGGVLIESGGKIT